MSAIASQKARWVDLDFGVVGVVFMPHDKKVAKTSAAHGIRRRVHQTPKSVTDLSP
ncbi:hypothetical protein [Rhodoferax sp.]|jgi:hypothetical protein|uniref:hypothetical protein n=1 Tax=Rhodoferax sp. TaxID=50421 RepID=UPI0027340BCD|nr:hypothetical protein [Rhodoferax sp.]MDP1943677.1 hypothetical protein [Rhodoferax sp.]